MFVWLVGWLSCDRKNCSADWYATVACLVCLSVCWFVCWFVCLFGWLVGCHATERTAAPTVMQQLLAWFVCVFVCVLVCLCVFVMPRKLRKSCRIDWYATVGCLVCLSVFWFVCVCVGLVCCVYVKNGTTETGRPNRLLYDYIIALLHDITEYYSQKWNSRERE